MVTLNILSVINKANTPKIIIFPFIQVFISKVIINYFIVAPMEWKTKETVELACKQLKNNLSLEKILKD
jgi:hypothetical protein